MHSRKFVAVSMLVIALAACSAEVTKGSGNKQNGNTAAGNGGGAGVVAGSSGDGSFGNTDNMGAGTGAVAPVADAGPDCKPGEFCKPPDECGSLTLETDVKTIKKPGNVLVIFDRSGSMDQEWNNVPKYESAGNALISALMPLQDLLTVGGIFFPSLDAAAAGGCTCNPADFTHWLPGGCCLMGAASSCVVTPISEPDQINFGTAANFITQLPTQWRLQGAGGTPLQQGVARGAEALMGTTFKDPVTVVILTDGQPTCGSEDQPVIDQVTAWAAQGIQTHVVGLPGAQGAADLLNAIAAAGGSGTYIDPANPAELQMRLNAIFTATIQAGFESCEMHLDHAADAPDELHLVVTQNGVRQDVDRNLSKDASWTINKAGDTVVLKGQLCDMAKDGSFEALTFEYGCVDLPPLEAPEPE